MTPQARARVHAIVLETAHALFGGHDEGGPEWAAAREAWIARAEARLTEAAEAPRPVGGAS